MAESSVYPWQILFPPPTTGAAVKWENFRVLRKQGHPWLLLPASAFHAQQALNLYPAQSVRAHLAKTALGLALGWGWFPRAETTVLARSRGQPWEQFLQTITGSTAFPPLAALAGNPATDGQRLVFLVFNRMGQPQWVVKVGAGGCAARLIEAEQHILKSLPRSLRGVPTLRGEFSHEKVRAFGMDFCVGTTPVTNDAAAPGPLLSEWIESDREAPLTELPAMLQLAAVCGTEDWFAVWHRAVASLVVRPVIMQGDFAPWNIKVSPQSGQWTVLDWERGDLNGVPGWDWFHFVIQPELLVKRRPVAVVAARLRRLLRSPGFQAYAQATRINGKEERLLAAYLAYAARVIKPSEGLAVTEQLWQEFRA